MNFHGLAVGCVTHHGLSRPTARLCHQLVGRGARLFEHTGASDVYVSRNMLLTEMLEQSECDVFLLLDDDNTLPLEHVARFVDFKRPDLNNSPLRSAVYGSATGGLVAQPMTVEAERLRVLSASWPSPLVPYATGMGCMAVRVEALREVAKRVPRFSISRWGKSQREYFAFCRTLTAGNLWLGDDGSFCALFGGAELDCETVSAHYKQVPIEPDSETIAALKSGRFFEVIK